MFIEANPMVLSSVYVDNFQIGYIFLANIIASLLTFVVLFPNYVYLSWKIDTDLWKRMMRYGTPIMVAGIAFAINEQFDKILLSKLLPADIAEAEVESIPLVISWVCSWFCIEQRIL
jgi:O-antigen/teichoic acid export membrane protein